MCPVRNGVRPSIDFCKGLIYDHAAIMPALLYYYLHFAQSSDKKSVQILQRTDDGEKRMNIRILNPMLSLTLNSTHWICSNWPG